MNTEILKKIQKIKLFLTDVDGVLTDGGLYYTAEGLVMKKFHVRDGMGVLLLRKAGLQIGILSGDNSELIRTRAKALKIDIVYMGILDKENKLDEICDKYNMLPENIAFIGDDVNDTEVIKKVGFSAAPADAAEEIFNMVDYKCKTNGGRGAFREVADLIIKHQNNFGIKIEEISI